MSAIRRQVTFALCCAVVVSAATDASTYAAESSRSTDPDARLDTFTTPGGESYFALSLRPNIELASADAHDVVVLFDTSASQTGIYREKALAALDSLLHQLGPNDRVRLMAVDLDTVALTDRFVPANGPDVQSAIEKLQNRVPLGSTDMAAALRAAIKSYSDDTRAARAVVYLGDGMSTANLLEKRQFAELTAELVKHRLAVSSYAVGPRIDAKLLAVLANQTGGNVAIARRPVAASTGDAAEDVTAEQAKLKNARNATSAGKFLAETARGVVLWPESVKYPTALAQVYPAATPPLRNDRDTVVIGTGKPDGEADVRMSVEVGTQAMELSWQIAPSQPNADHAYLVKLVETARADRGATLPTVGTAGLHELRRIAEGSVDNLNELARHAVATGNLDGADLFAQQALDRDPGNLQSQTIQGSVGRLRDQQQRGGSAVRLINLADGDVKGADAGEATPPAEVVDQGQFLDMVENLNQVITQQTRKEVEVLLNDARTTMADRPAMVIQQLKLKKEMVRRVPELDPDVRARLLDQMEGALKEAARQEQIKVERDREQQESTAAGRETIRISDALRRSEDKKKQLMDRFHALLDEGHYPKAVEVAAMVDDLTRPGETIGQSAVIDSHIALHYTENWAIRRLSQQAYVDTLLTVERSAIPFPDDPPIVYPVGPIGNYGSWKELSDARKDRWDAVDLKKPGSAEEKIADALDSTTNLEFVEESFSEVMGFIADENEINIQLDQRALDFAGVQTDTPVTIDLKGIRLRSALRLMLNNFDLTYMIKDEVLLITTPDEAENALTTKVYPVADLVIPIPQTGGFGGGGGGFGGGGGGGFGGGGGRGGGGGGFGGFNVPDVVPQAGGRRFQAFAVRDEVPSVNNNDTTTADATAADAKSADAKSADARSADASAGKSSTIGDMTRTLNRGSQAKTIAIDSKVEPEVYWSDYFSQSDVDAAAVRATVRQLTRAKKMDQTIVLIQSALRNGHAQPWMYEALGLAMQLDDRPKVEIERVLMSAADVCDGTDGLLYLAQYLARMGSDQRALQLYRQVTVAQPMRHEPYVLALRTAQRLNDVEAIRWATVGMLSHVWPNDQAEVASRARRVALVLLEDLEKSGRQDTADAYRQELNDAMIRDVMVRVTWTGDADVDLLVQEPTGTVCSLRRERTTGGGVMLGDNSAASSSASGSYSETYACSSAFPGDYRVLIRRIWGKVTAGKIDVEVWKNYKGADQRYERQQIALDDKDAVVAFRLDEGRRVGPVDELRTANAALGQVEVNRAILAQQLGSLSDPRVEGGLNRSRRLALIGRGRGAVGFQPVIEVLDEGTSLTVTGVVSADRRYVRISPRPRFTGIGEVFTFTFAGDSEQVGGGGGLNLGGGGGVGF